MIKRYAAILITIASIGVALRAQNMRVVRECAACHPNQAKPHPTTSMAHAMELPPEATILKSHPLLTFQGGSYSYRIERKGDQSIYTVTDGHETLTVPIGWAFGLGVAGQTYVFEHNGEFYETRVSFYETLNGLDLTMGAQNSPPENLIEAAGRIMGRDEKARCFGCHATGAFQGTQLTLANMTPGVQCERCHGSVDAHLTAVRKGDPGLGGITSLRKLGSEETSNFCGQCHRRWDEIAAGSVRGIADIRFQPYRLTNSKCYDSDDSRISCTACHDPHNEIVRSDAAYDGKCQACHAGGKPAAKACPVAKANCASCHMPKLDMPGSHHKFTDHEIRVVRANERYPD
jgi:hypothetical protein